MEHLDYLLGKKTLFTYGDQHVTGKDINLASLHAQRFMGWAYTEFKQVLRAQLEEAGA